MKSPTQAIDEIWKEGFFEEKNKTSTKEVNEELYKKFRITLTNTHVFLKTRPYLFYKNGWIQKKSPKNQLKKIKNKKINYFDILNIHPEIKAVSEKLFIDRYYAQAIEEAFKRIVLLVKEKSGRNDLDGCDLMTTVFSKNSPILKFNNLTNQIEKDEQQGWMHLYQGAVLGIRNVKAHSNIIQKDKIKTLEYLAFASLLCKRLEETTKI